MAKSIEYRALLAEDNPLIMERFVRLADWEGCGFKTILTAPDGLAAYRLFEQYSPELVLTDIQMPKMNGIELAEKIMKERPGTAVYFLTSYEEFSYAKAATNLNVRGYLLKHEMDQEKMNALLRSVHAQISRSRVRDSYSAQAALFGLFQELMTENGQVLRRQEYELQFPGRYNLLILEQGCIYPTMQRCFGASEAPVPEKDLRQIFRGMSAQPIAFVSQTPYRLIVLLDGGTPATAFASEAQAALQAQSGRCFQTWIIAEQAPIMRCAELFQQSAHIRDMGVFYPKNYLMYASFVAPPVSVEAPVPFDALDRYLQEKDCKAFLAQLDKAFLHAIECKDPVRFERLVDYCCQKLSTYNCKVVNVHTGETFRALDAHAQENWYDADRIYQWLRQRFEELFRLFSHTVASGYSEMTRAAIDYINQHFGDENLDLDNMAQRLGISSGRLNVLFKQETGETLWQLIIKVRMEHAKQLLQKPNARVSDVYPVCGYNSASYFSKVFKETFGITPKEYQRSVKQTKEP